MWAFLTLSLLLVVACGSDDGGETTDNRSSNAAPRTTMTIISRDNKFDITKLTVPVNQPITLTLENNGQAVHNWHLLDVKDAAGAEIATELLRAGQTETVTFTLAAPGTYTFRCDTHPTDMKGTLTVQ
jgi:plastocyanin